MTTTDTHTLDRITRTKSIATHVQSQLKQLELRARAGHRPTPEQLTHIAELTTSLTTQIAILRTEAQNARDEQLRTLLQRQANGPA